MRVAYIGVGHHHTAFYLDPVLRNPKHTVVGFADRDPDVARREADVIGCASSGDYRELVRAVKPDFVFALGRHCDMAEQGQFLLDEGIPFVMEKPCGISYEEVAALAQKADRKAAFAVPALVMRWNKVSAFVRETLAGDRVEYVAIRWFSGRTARYLDTRWPDGPQTWTWLLDPKTAGGGSLIHLGPIHIDCFRWLTGDPKISVRNAMLSNRAEGRPVEDLSLVTLEAGDGTIGVVETGYLTPQRPGGSIFDMHWMIRTDRHHLMLHGPDDVEVVDLATGSVRRLNGSIDNVLPWTAFCDDVLDLAAAGKRPAVNMADMADVMRLIQDSYRLAGPLPTASSPSLSTAG